MKTVLVTGALGVIGSAVTRRLTADGYRVISADLLVADGDDYVRLDVIKYEDLSRLGRKERIDVVVHMAGEVGRLVGENQPQRMIYVNNVGTTNIVQFCLEHKADLLYFSTSEVYGTLLRDGVPVAEDLMQSSASAFSTENIYALSKLFGEAIVSHYVMNYDLSAATVRPFMVYGPGERPVSWRSAMTNFVYAARHGQPLKVHRGAARAWCYVDDFVDGVVRVLERPVKTTGQYHAYNIGSDDYKPMEEVARTIIRVVGGKESQVEVLDVPNPFGSLVKRADLSKIRSIGFDPRWSLEDGVEQVAKWQQSQGL